MNIDALLAWARSLPEHACPAKEKVLGPMKYNEYCPVCGASVPHWYQLEGAA